MFGRKPKDDTPPKDKVIQNKKDDYDDPFSDVPDEEDVPPSSKIEKPGLLDKVSMQSPSEAVVTSVLFFGTFFVLFYFIGAIMIKLSTRGSGMVVHVDPVHYIGTLLYNGGPGVFIMAMLMGLLGGYAAARAYANHLVLKDDNYVIRANVGTYGSSDWIDKYPKEFRETFDLSGTLDDPGYVPIGMYKGKMVSMPEKPKFNQFTNQNIAVIAGSGSGKSFSILTPMLRSRIRYGESFVITDTKGDLYRKNAKLCEDNGYNVILFNTTDFSHSDSWDCLDDLAMASEKDIYNYVNIWSNTFMENTHGAGERKDFWYNNEHDLLRSLMHLVARDAQYEGKRTFEELINLINSTETEIREKLFAAEGRVQHAARSYLAATKDDVREQFRAGLANRLQIYRTPLVARALSEKGIDMERIVHEKTAVFVVTKDSDNTYDAITSLFIGCLYMKLIEMSDSANYKGSLNIPFWFILDELCNMGAIDALPRKIATSRSRKINFAFALQSMSQLDDKYVRMANNILANCALKIILGCDDEMTAKYVSSKAGTFTQLEISDATQRPYFGFLRKLQIPLHTRESRRYSKKNLIEIADVSQIPPGKMYALISRHHVFRGDTYREDLHYMEAFVEEREVSDYVPEWYLRFEDEHPEMKDSPGRTYIPSEYEKLETRMRVARKNPLSAEEKKIIVENHKAEMSSYDALKEKAGVAVGAQGRPQAPESYQKPQPEYTQQADQSGMLGAISQAQPAYTAQNARPVETAYRAAAPMPQAPAQPDITDWDDEIF